MSWRHNSNGYPYICDHAGHVPGTLDIARRWLRTEIQDGDRETGSGNNVLTVMDGAAIPTYTPTFSTMPDMDMALSTLSDVGRLPKFKMAAIETGSGGHHLEFRLLANVGQCRQYHRRVRHGRKCGVAVAVGSQTHSVQ